MKQEIEVKFLQINLEEVRAKLRLAGGKLVMPLTSLRRVILETPEMRMAGAFVRIRDEGDGKITATYKQHGSLSLGGASEIELGVDDFETAVKLFEATHLTNKSYQETKRETWMLNGVMVTIDIWPWLDPLVEIEGDSDAEVKAAATTLGFDWNDAVFGGIMVAYQRQYPNLSSDASIIDLPEVKFNSPVPEMLK